MTWSPTPCVRFRNIPSELTNNKETLERPYFYLNNPAISRLETSESLQAPYVRVTPPVFERYSIVTEIMPLSLQPLNNLKNAALMLYVIPSCLGITIFSQVSRLKIAWDSLGARTEGYA